MVLSCRNVQLDDGFTLAMYLQFIGVVPLAALEEDE
jgi:hypothetical protein